MGFCRLVPASRRFWERPADLLILGLGGLGLAVGAWMAVWTGQPVLVGLLRRVTGVPCPLCRGTRAAEALALARPLEAFYWNPLATLLMLAVVAWAVLRVGCGRRIEWQLQGRGRVAAWSVAVAVILANWAYVIAMGG